MGTLCFPFLNEKDICRESGDKAILLFLSSSVHQGHSSLHVSQRAAQKCGHSFTFLPSSLLLRVWQEHSCGDETVGEKKGWVGGLKVLFLDFGVWRKLICCAII